MLYFRNLVLNTRTPLLAVAALSLLIPLGCQKGNSEASSNGAAPKASQKRAAAAPEAHVYVDEPTLGRPYSVIGGAVENAGARRLEGLTVEVELKRRADGSVERREVPVEPDDLEPGQRGKFSLKVLAEEWGNSRVVKLLGGARQEEVAFKALPGAKRPPERIKDNVVIVKTPAKKKSDGSEFINTPDNPYSVP